MAEEFRRVAIVGLGLKGGSLAMILRKKRIAKEVVGIDTDKTILTKVVHRDIVDQAVAELAEGLPQADLVVIAVPTHSTSEVLASVAPHLKAGAIVCDVGRLKGPVLEKAGEILADHNPFVGCHPVVYMEDKDIDEAYPALFQNRPCILTLDKGRDEEAVNRVKKMWEAAGCKIEEMDPEVHDRLFSVLEDIPVLLLRLIRKTAGQANRYVDEVEDYFSRELKEIAKIDTTLSPQVTERFWANRRSIVHVLAYYRLKLKELSEVLQGGSLQDLQKLL
ncbi:MAG: prephenate dehydrogenase/arogenate dehydrogenase family protein [Deltaproteobacteria bacterium]|nr:prephenate dehydrogenase/arogenate dehydrogenase family protein [Deltaproteobacteria bacterium]